MRRERLFLLPISACLVTACGDCGSPPTAPEPPSATTAEVAAIDLDDPNACAACHATVVDEWRTSMHASAHHSNDPIFAALRALRIERQGEQIAAECGSCHHPLAAREPDAPLAAQGVGCRSCHGVAEVKPDGTGHEALVYDDGRVLHGALELAADASPAHGTGSARSHFTDGTTLCLACHREAHNPAGVPTCTTGIEHAALGEAASCASCHMPEVEGASGSASTRASHRSHAFVGPHHAWRSEEEGAFLRESVALEARFEGGELVVTLENRAAHGFPTGYPGRLAVVQAVARDAGGDEVWRAWREQASERPETMLMRAYVDAEGAPTMPPFAAALARDSRFEPGETRTLRFEVPAAAASAEVSLRFFLIPPPAAATLGLADSPVATPRLVARAEVTR